MKKIITIFVVGMLSIMATGCFGESTTTTTTTTITEPADYPYMEYLESSVSIYKVKEKIGSEWLTAITGVIGAEHNYNTIEFSAKEGTEIKSMTFSITAKKDCEVHLLTFFNAPEWTKEDTIIRCFIDPEVDSIYKEKTYTLKANQASTFTVETTARRGGVAYNAGLYPVGTSEERKKLKLYFYIKIPNALGSASYDVYRDEEVYIEHAIKFSNISFDIGKM